MARSVPRKRVREGGRFFRRVGGTNAMGGDRDQLSLAGRRAGGKHIQKTNTKTI